jgi:hypothetical protein
VTNLPATRYRLDVLYRAYKWRWQVELLCNNTVANYEKIQMGCGV